MCTDSSQAKRKIKKVVVYCGANSVAHNAFADAAKELGKALLCRNISLVYGGGSNGIMGVIAKTVYEGGGDVEGIMPKMFLKEELSESHLIGKTIAVEDMHERKKLFCEKADAFIALPGGLGTLDEIIEMLCWARLGLHSKPIGILNILNFYGGILDWYDNAMKIGFLDPGNENLYTVSDNCEHLLDALENQMSEQDFQENEKNYETQKF